LRWIFSLSPSIEYSERSDIGVKVLLEELALDLLVEVSQGVPRHELHVNLGVDLIHHIPHRPHVRVRVQHKLEPTWGLKVVQLVGAGLVPQEPIIPIAGENSVHNEMGLSIERNPPHWASGDSF